MDLVLTFITVETGEALSTLALIIIEDGDAHGAVLTRVEAGWAGTSVILH